MHQILFNFSGKKLQQSGRNVIETIGPSEQNKFIHIYILSLMNKSTTKKSQSQSWIIPGDEDENI